jgi:protein TonB
MRVGSDAFARVGLVLCALALAGCVTSRDLPLRFVSGEGPEYPPAARAQSLEGYVIVRYDVTAEGAVENVRVVGAEPTGVFDAAAVAAVSAWRFAAPTRDGVPQAASNRESRVEFRLGQTDAYAR